MCQFTSQNSMQGSINMATFLKSFLKKSVSLIMIIILLLFAHATGTCQARASPEADLVEILSKTPVPPSAPSNETERIIHANGPVTLSIPSVSRH